MRAASGLNTKQNPTSNQCLIKPQSAVVLWLLHGMEGITIYFLYSHSSALVDHKVQISTRAESGCITQQEKSVDCEKISTAKKGTEHCC